MVFINPKIEELPDGTEIIKTQELCDRWGVALQTLYNWRTIGRGPQVYKYKKWTVYKLEDVIAWEQEYYLKPVKPYADNKDILGVFTMEKDNG